MKVIISYESVPEKIWGSQGPGLEKCLFKHTDKRIIVKGKNESRNCKFVQMKLKES